MFPWDLLKGRFASRQWSDELGRYGTISSPREELPSSVPNVPGLMRPGLYWVEVTHKNVKIPEKYNTKTTLEKRFREKRSTAAESLWI